MAFQLRIVHYIRSTITRNADEIKGLFHIENRLSFLKCIMIILKMIYEEDGHYYICNYEIYKGKFTTIKNIGF